MAGVDGWALIEILKGWDKLERFAQAGKARALADLGERRYDTRASWAHDGDPGTTWTGAVQRPVGEDLFGELSRHAAQEVGLALGIPSTRRTASRTGWAPSSPTCPSPTSSRRSSS